MRKGFQKVPILEPPRVLYPLGALLFMHCLGKNMVKLMMAKRRDERLGNWVGKPWTRPLEG